MFISSKLFFWPGRTPAAEECDATKAATITVARYIKRPADDRSFYLVVHLKYSFAAVNRVKFRRE